MRIRIRIQHYLIAAPDTGFDDLKLKKNLAGNFMLFSWSKIAIYLSLGLHKERPRYRRSIQHSKENILHFKTWKFCTFFLFLWIIFALLDPDPIQQLKLMRIRIRNSETFDNGVIFDIEGKRTPSIVSKLFSKRSEHIRRNKNYFRSEANMFNSKTTVFKAKANMFDSKKIILKAKPTH